MAKAGNRPAFDGAAPSTRRRLRPPRLRLLPVTIAVAGAMLTVRVNDIWNSVANHDLSAISISRSEAQQPPPPPGGRTAGQASPTQPASTPPAGGGTLTANPPTMLASAGPAPGAVPGTAPAAVAPTGGGEAPPTFTQDELDVLTKLSQRRAELDQREQAIDSRENLIKAAEARIDQKVTEMKALQDQIQGLLKQVDAQDDQRLKNLTTIYQNMKPADAARIFEQLDLPVVLGVVTNMKPQNVAPILAAMDPEKAKTITDAMAARRAAAVEGAAGG